MNLVTELRKRIDWAKAEPMQVIDKAGTTRMQYVKGLMRPSGSYVEGLELGEEPEPMQPLFDLFEAIDEQWDTREVTEKLKPPIRFGDCQYFVASVPDGYKAFTGTGRLCDLDEEALAAVRVVKGAHGFELQTDGCPFPTDVICFILDGDGIVTWHPGHFAAHVSLDDAAVKYTR